MYMNCIYTYALLYVRGLRVRRPDTVYTNDLKNVVLFPAMQATDPDQHLILGWFRWYPNLIMWCWHDSQRHNNAQTMDSSMIHPYVTWSNEITRARACVYVCSSIFHPRHRVGRDQPSNKAVCWRLILCSISIRASAMSPECSDIPWEMTGSRRTKGIKWGVPQIRPPPFLVGL